MCDMIPRTQNYRLHIQKFNALNHNVIVMAIFILYYRLGFKWLNLLFEVRFLHYSDHRATKRVAYP